MLLALTVPVSALEAQGTIHEGRPADRDAVIRLFLPAGFLRVTTWERDSLDVRGRLDGGATSFMLGGPTPSLKGGVKVPPARSTTASADLEVRMPRDARVRIQSGAAEVEVTAAGGSVEVVGTSGRVRVVGRADRVSVETLDGNIELAAVAREGTVRSADGTVVVRGVLDALDASTVNGPLYVGMEGPISRARLETVSSEIAFKGRLTHEGRLMAETHGGDIELRLPPSIGASFHLVSYGPGIRNKMVPAEAVAAGPEKGEWTFTTGDGAAVVDVRTFKGRVVLLPRAEE
jgi:DUF4097 and DUF4098 domain-containing protein YvlB